MARNDFRKLKDWELQKRAELAASVIGADPAKYGATPEQAAELAARAAELASKIGNVSAALAAYRSQVVAKDEEREETAGLLAHMAQRAYADPAIADDDLAAAGFAVHDRIRTRVRAFTPMGLVANPDSNGTVRLAWDRSGNRPGVTFLVEHSPDGRRWTVLTLTARTSLVLRGFRPGVPAWFRVYARSATQRSPASMPSGIYVGSIGAAEAA